MIIIPDVHGRKMWKEACSKAQDNETIIFLGDYLDPYPDDFPKTKILDLQTQAIENFKEIIEYKKGHKNVILLVGNHDLGYFVSRRISSCRSDLKHYDDIRKLFIDNKKLFQFCHKAVINGKTYIFSHAGIRYEWLDMFKENKDIDVCDWLNNEFDIMINDEYPSETSFATELAIYSYWRGWTGEKNGSPIWSDVREWLIHYEKDLNKYKEYQIFGHTRSSFIIAEYFAMLDDSDKPRGVRLNDEGQLEELDGTKINQNIQDILKS